jgi:hypothetical protein
VRFAWLVTAVGLLGTGCIYVDPINRRPKLQPIECYTDDLMVPCGLAPNSPLPELHRGDSIKLKAVYSDPDSRPDDSVLHWTVAACDSCMLETCTVFYDEEVTTPAFVVPKTVGLTGKPVQCVLPELELFDDRGASQSANDSWPVLDGPTLALGKSARSYTVGSPIKLFATYGDPDQGSPPADVSLLWTVFTPDAQPAYTLTDLEIPVNTADPAHVTLGKTLVPREVGEWDVRVMASNASVTNEKHLKFTVAADHPPCLAEWQPIVPPAGATLPIAVPTVFQVPLVDDDLDPYPQVPGEPLLGTTRFEWSILAPGAAQRQRLVGATGNSVDFDPGVFTPGDLVELRVEIFDRNHAPVSCADDAVICLGSSLPGCNQRQTWLVEVR